jgi:hypothetical protein
MGKNNSKLQIPKFNPFAIPPMLYLEDVAWPVNYRKDTVNRVLSVGMARAIEINAGHALAYYNRGIALQSAGDSVGSQRDLERSAQLNPQLRESVQNRLADR